MLPIRVHSSSHVAAEEASHFESSAPPDRTMGSGDTAVTVALPADLKLSHISLYATVCSFLFGFGKCFEMFLEGTAYCNSASTPHVLVASLTLPLPSPQGHPQFPYRKVGYSPHAFCVA